MSTFPVDLEAWLTPFRVVEQTFDLEEGLQVQNRTAGGEVIRAGGASRLWHGKLVLGRVRNDQVGALEARLHVLRGKGAYFTIRDYRRAGAISATLATVQANGTVNISGGPANGTLNDGDYIAFGYANRIALHRIVVGGALSGTGARNGVEVVPPIRAGWTANTPVQIGSVRCRAVMVPGTLNMGQSRGIWHEGISFEWIQMLRENP
ncbi:hypothetical protein [Paracoccus chinensis]|uniref:Uncharacterized protein n=1 Tax=Paracoccus chinensis TaxID=525640 RepID=A0A1G9JJ07_9RHOB|nr:hypothetical protein [Paracoccus chinensis]SDL37245.1 hypothetical protein SAMN04487971_109147 [Paracoccus chinensis]